MQIPTRALSVRAPWWWAILHAGKDIENRSRRHSFRGRVWLHASKWYRPDIVAADRRAARECMTAAGNLEWRGPAHHAAMAPVRNFGGCIVGSVEIVDCVTASPSPWFFGPVGFVLREPIPLARPVPCKGALGFFPVPGDVLERLAA